jgi:hypothetical protein
LRHHSTDGQLIEARLFILEKSKQEQGRTRTGAGAP